MQASTCLFHDFYGVIHFSHHAFSNKHISLEWEAHFLKTPSNTFDQKHRLFAPRMASKILFVADVACFCRFVARSVRSWPPSKTACGCSPVLFSPPSPVYQNDGMHIGCHFVNFVSNLLLFFLHFMVYTSLSPLFGHFFKKSASRLRWGA